MHKVRQAWCELRSVATTAWEAPKSNRAAALALSEQVAPGHTVVIVDEQLAMSRFMPTCVHWWCLPVIGATSSWRRRAAGATIGSMQPGLRLRAAARRVALLQMDQLDRATCVGKAVWLAMSMGKSGRVAALTGARRVYADAKTELWRAPAPVCCAWAFRLN